MPRIPKPSGRKTRKEIPVSYGRHLIYAEGEKTEPLYVNNISKIIKQNYQFHNTDIIIENVPHKGYNTIGLVEFAEEDVKKRLNQNEKIDHVWIFFDKDSFPQDDFDNAHYKIESKNHVEYKNDDDDHVDEYNICWHSIWSNECFELWVFLHFEYLETSLSRDTYIPKINENYLIDDVYEKNRKDLYELLKRKGNVQQAIRFATRLYEDHGLDNPSTGIYRFLLYFDKYLNKSA